mmetsp:Transcript_10351/g.16248  ORF Transcript_10351/g.16248 Transcript_10351/m.16248 type:complete len:840 (-) Transcript_10351:39-2558(-)
MVELKLRKGSSGSGLGKRLRETERLGDGQVGAHVGNTTSHTGTLIEDLSTSHGKNVVNRSSDGSGASDVNQKHGLQKSGGTAVHTGVSDTTRAGRDLSHTSVNSISVKSHIIQVHAQTADALLAKGSLVTGPLESSHHGVLDLSKVGNTDSALSVDVRSNEIVSEAPDLLGGRSHISEIRSPIGVLTKDLGSLLQVHARVNLIVVEHLTDLLVKGLSGTEKSVMLVGRLGKNLTGLLSDGFVVGNHGVGSVEGGTLHEIIGKILQADLQMKLSATSNDMLTGLGGLALNHGVRLGKLLKTLNKLGKILGVLYGDSHTHHRGHGELHGLDAASRFKVGNGTRLHQVGINTNKTASVTSGDIGNSLGVTTHHDHDSLDRLGEQVSLLAGDEVRSKDAHLLASSDLTGEHTAESDETVIGTGNHLRDVHHKGAAIGGVASADSLGSLIVHGAIVQGLSTVNLRSGGGRQLDDNHLQHSVGGGEPLLHDSLKKGLAGKGLLLLLGEVDTDVLGHVKCLELSLLVQLVVHDGSEHVHDGVHDEGNERTLGARFLVSTTVGVDSVGLHPLGLAVNSDEAPISPKLLDHLLDGSVELGSVHGGEHLQGESPLMKTRTESNGGRGGVNLPVEVTEVVRLNDDVHVLNSETHVLVDLLTSQLKLEKSSVNLVHHKHGLHTLSHGLTKHGTGLDSDTINGIDDHKGTIGHSEGSSHLRREINVTGRIDQVNKKGVLSDVDVVGTTLGHLLGKSLTLDDLTGLQVVLEKHTDTSRLDGNTTLLLIGTGVGVTGVTGMLGRDNTSLAHKRIGQSGLSVIDVSNNRHVTNVMLVVHDGTHLISSKVHHLDNK